ncbi:Mor transcription activator family protein [Acinetobacter haemolyticus]|uniref:Mor transcription activator family protein n=1 Tax=Acinetobacter haemolyticus TaxID=29430 RepID=UPI000F743722|nr:Mor transcription activator family protein [Acinetobacter haemolyticus]RSN77914.1 hypothetical protein EA769_03585 [Acinetobacter haemolyticus]
MNDEFLDKLPETLKTMVRLTDLTTTLAMVQHYGGRDVKLPTLKMVNDRHELAQLIGFNNLKKLCEYWSGDMIYIPYAREYAEYLRHEKIRRDSEKLHEDEVAKKYGISSRWVRELKRRWKQPKLDMKKDDRQLDMFE